MPSTATLGSDNDSKQAAFMMPVDLYDRALEVAREQDLTFSQVMRRALRDFLARDRISA